MSDISLCAFDKGICSWASGTPTQNVIYQSIGTNHFRDVDTNSIACNQVAFGYNNNDKSYPGVCYRRNKPVYSVTNGLPDGFTLCSPENATCNISTPSDILYGANGNFYSGIGQSGQSFPCNSNTFGDPKSGTKNNCYFRPLYNAPSNNPAPSITQPQPNVPTSNSAPYMNPIQSAINSSGHPNFIPGSYINRDESISPSVTYITPGNSSLNGAPTGTFLLLDDTVTKATFYGWKNMDIAGKTIYDMPFTTDSESDCALICMDNPKCNYYTFNNNNNNCYLKTLNRNTEGNQAKFIIAHQKSYST